MKNRESSVGAGEFQVVERYGRTVNYLAAAQIYTKDNPLLEVPFVPTQ